MKGLSKAQADALPAVISALRARGYSFVTLDALRGLGYHALTSGGGVYSVEAPGYGSATALPAGLRGTGLAADRATGGYWVLKSNGGVDNNNAPWHGPLNGNIPAGETVAAPASE